MNLFLNKQSYSTFFITELFLRAQRLRGGENGGLAGWTWGEWRPAGNCCAHRWYKLWDSFSMSTLSPRTGSVREKRLQRWGGRKLFPQCWAGRGDSISQWNVPPRKFICGPRMFQKQRCLRASRPPRWLHWWDRGLRCLAHTHRSPQCGRVRLYFPLEEHRLQTWATIIMCVLFGFTSLFKKCNIKSFLFCFFRTLYKESVLKPAIYNISTLQSFVINIPE